MNDFPKGVDRTEATLRLLIEAWLVTAQIAAPHDTASAAILIGTLRTMSDGLRADDRGYLSDILDGWIAHLEGDGPGFSQALEDARR